MIDTTGALAGFYLPSTRTSYSVKKANKHGRKYTICLLGFCLL